MGMLQWVALLIGGIGLLCCGRQAVAGERIAVAYKAVKDVDAQISALRAQLKGIK